MTSNEVWGDTHLQGGQWQNQGSYEKWRVKKLKVKTNMNWRRNTEFHPSCQNCRFRYGSNLAKVAGSQVDGTACLTWSRSTICPFESATLYSVTYQPSKASVLVLAASFCQLPENSNIVLKKPDGIFPDKDSSWLNCSDICKILKNLSMVANWLLSTL